MIVFNKGDRIVNDAGMQATVSHIVDDKVWAYWDHLDGDKGRGPYWVFTRYCKLAMMPYDPNQQGDTEDDI